MIHQQNGLWETRPHSIQNINKIHGNHQDSRGTPPRHQRGGDLEIANRRRAFFPMSQTRVVGGASGVSSAPVHPLDCCTCTTTPATAVADDGDKRRQVQ